MIKVSVILPIYNQAPLVGRAISSVIGQTFFNWELIIVTDGSLDARGEVADAYAKHDKRINILNISERGEAAARDHGINCGRGELLTFLDADDYYQPDHLIHQLVRFELKPELMLLHGTPTVLGNPYIRDVHRPTETIPISDCALPETFFVRPSVYKLVGRLPKIPFGEGQLLYERACELGLTTERILMPTYVLDRTGERAGKRVPVS